MEDEDLCVAVVDEVRELVVEIPVVDVDRRRTVLAGAVLGDQVLRAVVEVEGDLCRRLDPGRLEGGGEACRGVVELEVADPAVALDQCVLLAQRIRHDLPRGREVDFHGTPCLEGSDSISNLADHVRPPFAVEPASPGQLGRAGHGRRCRAGAS